MANGQFWAVVICLIVVFGRANADCYDDALTSTWTTALVDARDAYLACINAELDTVSLDAGTHCNSPNYFNAESLLSSCGEEYINYVVECTNDVGAEGMYYIYGGESWTVWGLAECVPVECVATNVYDDVEPIIANRLDTIADTLNLDLRSILNKLDCGGTTPTIELRGDFPTDEYGFAMVGLSTSQPLLDVMSARADYVSCVQPYTMDTASCDIDVSDASCQTAQDTLVQACLAMDWLPVTADYQQTAGCGEQHFTDYIVCIPPNAYSATSAFDTPTAGLRPRHPWERVTRDSPDDAGMLSYLTFANLPTCASTDSSDYYEYQYNVDTTMQAYIDCISTEIAAAGAIDCPAYNTLSYSLSSFCTAERAALYAQCQTSLLTIMEARASTTCTSDASTSSLVGLDFCAVSSCTIDNMAASITTPDAGTILEDYSNAANMLDPAGANTVIARALHSVSTCVETESADYATLFSLGELQDRYASCLVSLLDCTTTSTVEMSNSATWVNADATTVSECEQIQSDLQTACTDAGFKLWDVEVNTICTSAESVTYNDVVLCSSPTCDWETDISAASDTISLLTLDQYMFMEGEPSLAGAVLLDHADVNVVEYPAAVESSMCVELGWAALEPDVQTERDAYWTCVSTELALTSDDTAAMCYDFQYVSVNYLSACWDEMVAYRTACVNSGNAMDPMYLSIQATNNLVQFLDCIPSTCDTQPFDSTSNELTDLWLGASAPYENAQAIYEGLDCGGGNMGLTSVIPTQTMSCEATEASTLDGTATSLYTAMLGQRIAYEQCVSAAVVSMDTSGCTVSVTEASGCRGLLYDYYYGCLDLGWEFYDLQLSDPNDACGPKTYTDYGYCGPASCSTEFGNIVLGVDYELYLPGEVSLLYNIGYPPAGTTLDATEYSPNCVMQGWDTVYDDVGVEHDAYISCLVGNLAPENVTLCPYTLFRSAAWVSVCNDELVAYRTACHNSGNAMGPTTLQIMNGDTLNEVEFCMPATCTTADLEDPMNAIDIALSDLWTYDVRPFEQGSAVFESLGCGMAMDGGYASVRVHEHLVCETSAVAAMDSATLDLYQTMLVDRSYYEMDLWIEDIECTEDLYPRVDPYAYQMSCSALGWTMYTVYSAVNGSSCTPDELLGYFYCGPSTCEAEIDSSVIQIGWMDRYPSELEQIVYYWTPAANSTVDATPLPSQCVTLGAEALSADVATTREAYWNCFAAADPTLVCSNGMYNDARWSNCAAEEKAFRDACEASGNAAQAVSLQLARNAPIDGFLDCIPNTCMLATTEDYWSLGEELSMLLSYSWTPYNMGEMLTNTINCDGGLNEYTYVSVTTRAVCEVAAVSAMDNATFSRYETMLEARAMYEGCAASDPGIVTDCAVVYDTCLSEDYQVACYDLGWQMWEYYGSSDTICPITYYEGFFYCGPAECEAEMADLKFGVNDTYPLEVKEFATLVSPISSLNMSAEEPSPFPSMDPYWEHYKASVKPLLDEYQGCMLDGYDRPVCGGNTTYHYEDCISEQMSLQSMCQDEGFETTVVDSTILCADGETNLVIEHLLTCLPPDTQADWEYALSTAPNEFTRFYIEQTVPADVQSYATGASTTTVAKPMNCTLEDNDMWESTIGISQESNAYLNAVRDVLFLVADSGECPFDIDLEDIANFFGEDMSAEQAVLDDARVAYEEECTDSVNLELISIAINAVCKDSGDDVHTAEIHHYTYCYPLTCSEDDLLAEAAATDPYGRYSPSHIGAALTSATVASPYAAELAAESGWYSVVTYEEEDDGPTEEEIEEAEAAAAAATVVVGTSVGVAVGSSVGGSMGGAASGGASGGSAPGGGASILALIFQAQIASIMGNMNAFDNTAFVEFSKGLRWVNLQVEADWLTIDCPEDEAIGAESEQSASAGNIVYFCFSLTGIYFLHVVLVAAYKASLESGLGGDSLLKAIENQAKETTEGSGMQALLTIPKWEVFTLLAGFQGFVSSAAIMTRSECGGRAAAGVISLIVLPVAMIYMVYWFCKRVFDTHAEGVVSYKSIPVRDNLESMKTLLTEYPVYYVRAKILRQKGLVEPDTTGAFHRGYWVDVQGAEFVTKFGGLFDKYTGTGRIFVIVDLFRGFLTGVITGAWARGSYPGGQSGMLTALNAGYCYLLAAYLPYNVLWRNFEELFAFCGNTLAMIIVASEGPQVSGSISSLVMDIQFALMMFKAAPHMLGGIGVLTKLPELLMKAKNSAVSAAGSMKAAVTKKKSGGDGESGSGGDGGEDSGEGRFSRMGKWIKEKLNVAAQYRKMVAAFIVFQVVFWEVISEELGYIACFISMDWNQWRQDKATREEKKKKEKLEKAKKQHGAMEAELQPLKSDDKPTKQEPASEEPAKPEPANGESAKPEPAKPEPAKPEPANEESAKPKPEPESGKPDSPPATPSLAAALEDASEDPAANASASAEGSASSPGSQGATANVSDPASEGAAAAAAAATAASTPTDPGTITVSVPDK